MREHFYQISYMWLRVNNLLAYTRVDSVQNPVIDKGSADKKEEKLWPNDFFLKINN